MCHLILYSHPARRAHTDSTEVQPQTFLQGTSTLGADAYGSEAHASKGCSKGAELFGLKTYASLPDISLSGGHAGAVGLGIKNPQEARAQLLSEMQRNGCAEMLMTREGNSLWEVVDKKLLHVVHQTMGSPLNEAEMMCVILYTGSDMYKDYRMAELRTMFDKWPVFSILLTQAILKLAIADKRPAPDLVWHGLSGIRMPKDDELKKQEHLGGYSTMGELPFVYGTAVSTTFSKDVAMDFAGSGIGTLLQVKLNLPPQNREGRQIGYWNRTTVGSLGQISADVSWISKFPDECERLFPGGLIWYSSGRPRQRLGNFEVIEIDGMCGASFTG